MQTLRAHNHFAPVFGVDSYYRIGYEFPRESAPVSIRARPTNTCDRTNIHTQERPEIQVEAVKEQARFSEETVPTCANEERCDNGKVVPLTCEPPRDNNSPAVFVSETFVPDFMSSIDKNTPEREYSMRCVMIGAENTGKHALISSNFSEEPRQIRQEKNGVDLLIKTAVKFQTTKKYQFWMRTLGGHSETKEAIWKTYYKCANAFVFVYDTTNKQSFEALEEAVRNVLQVVPQDKFFGILVGNKNDLYKERAVDYNDAVDFKRKYNFSHFIETSSLIEEQTPHLLPRLDSKLKLTFESI